MDRRAIEEMYDMTDFTWATYVEFLAKLPEGALRAPVPGSGWPALINAFGHINYAYDRWLHQTLKARAVIVAEPASVADWLTVEDWRAQARASFRSILDGTPDERLDVADIPVWYDERARMSTADVLTHVLLHERGHHGDISTLFYQQGVEMPSMDYGMYLWVRRKRVW
jgi:uncharacterized damage-inducible protein DinB